MNPDTLYPSQYDHFTVYLKNVVKNPFIEVGDFTILHDMLHNPLDFEKTSVLYHYPGANKDHLKIGKFCSVGAGAKFIFNAANHTMHSLSSYPFPVMDAEWNVPDMKTTDAWDNHGDIIIGNDVWIGFEALILAGVTIGDGAIIGTRAVVTKDVPPYTIVGGIPAKPIRKRFDDATIAELLNLRWWDWPPEQIQKAIPAIQHGDLDALKNTPKSMSQEAAK